MIDSDSTKKNAYFSNLNSNRRCNSRKKIIMIEDVKKLSEVLEEWKENVLRLIFFQNDILIICGKI